MLETYFILTLLGIILSVKIKTKIKQPIFNLFTVK